ncbi:hypothetical protein C8Q77DRAFT_1046741 [Trametes polyzona]|nr:hypothetical protein C8Q77DRAFT_1046741 [Trametes polyzona]
MPPSSHLGPVSPTASDGGEFPSGPKQPPPLPPRPSGIKVSRAPDEESLSGSEEEPATFADADMQPGSVSSENLLTTKEEEQLSEVQLRELYDDEEIERFLHLFSTYVREVRATSTLPSPSVAQAASASAPALSETLSATARSPAPTAGPSKPPSVGSLSERIAVDFLVPLLPPPRPPPPEFSLSRLKHTAQRLYVALEPLYSLFTLPLLRLANWQNPRRSFTYCALYWILWYHGLLLSALLLYVLYRLVRRKIHPYPSLAELRAHRSRIDRSHTFGSLLSARLAASPALGIEDMWHLFKDYQHTRKLKKAEKSALKAGWKDKGDADDAASIHSVATEQPEENHEATSEHVDDEDLKRLGLFLLCEAADLLERIKNIFLWRNPSASVFYGAFIFGWFVLGLLPAQYLVRFVGFLVGGFFWHIVPIVASIPESDRARIPPPLSRVPTDAEYAMDLISQRVARGLPVRPKRRGRRRHSSDASIAGVAAQSERGHHSSSIDWNKWGDRLATTKERAGEIKKIFRDGQWKQSENWKAALAPQVVTSQSGPETRVEAHTFPAQLKQHPGLITLTPTTLFFTPLLSSRAALTIPLSDVTGVKKSSLMKGIDIRYSEPRADGSAEAKEAKFLFVASRDDLFARLVSWGGKRWTNV